MAAGFGFVRVAAHAGRNTPIDLIMASGLRLVLRPGLSLLALVADGEMLRECACVHDSDPTFSLFQNLGEHIVPS
jgi:hypothetical protein